MTETLKQEDQTRVFVTLWAIWHARRKAIHEQVYQSPLSVHLFVENFIADLKPAGVQATGKKTTPAEAGTKRWTPPSEGVVKINIDAVVSKNTGYGSVAAVARDENGRYRGASARVFPGKTDDETLEALAVREAVDLAMDIDVRRVQVASDCNNVVTSLKDGTMGVYAHIVNEILSSKTRFISLEFCFESRVVNKEAHSLARSVVRDDLGHRLWLIQPPEGFCIPPILEL
jgi:ribonuclease HI